MKAMTEDEFKLIIEDHKQLYIDSCVPACVDLILKLNGLIANNENPEQLKQHGKSVGFGSYNAVEISGLKFEQILGDAVTLENRIRLELAEGRFPAVSLISSENPLTNSVTYHMWVVVGIDADSNSLFAVSKSSPIPHLGVPSVTIVTTAYSTPNLSEQIKKIVLRNGRSDILVYQR